MRIPGRVQAACCACELTGGTERTMNAAPGGEPGFASRRRGLRGPLQQEQGALQALGAPRASLAVADQAPERGAGRVAADLVVLVDVDEPLGERGGGGAGS